MPKRSHVIFSLAAAAVLAAAVILPGLKSAPETHSEAVPAAQASDRISYFALHGWEVEEIAGKSVTIPDSFSGIYEEYARIQDKQGLPLRELAGREATLYLYRVRNYSPGSSGLLAELLVCDDIAAASLVYSEDGGSIMMPVS